jgi:hypothetical protein
MLNEGPDVKISPWLAIYPAAVPWRLGFNQLGRPPGSAGPKLFQGKTVMTPVARVN